MHPRLATAVPATTGTAAADAGLATGRPVRQTARRTPTETVQAWRQHLPRGMRPLPRPGPRSRWWLTRNPWFESDLLPILHARVADALAG